jgi:WD40 repeat protein
MKTEKRLLWQWALAVVLVAMRGQHALGQQVKPLATLRGHAGPVYSLAFSPDSRMLASGSLDSTVRLWEVLTGKGRATLKGHTRGASAVAFAPDGRHLASGDYNGVVRLWDASGRVRGSLKAQGWGGDWFILCLRFSPDGTALAAGGSGSHLTGQLRLWDVRRRKERLALRGHAGAFVAAVAFSADGRTLAGGDFDRRVTVWEVASGGVRASFRGHEPDVKSVLFAPGGGLLAAGGYDGMVRLWDVWAGRERFALKGHDDHVFGVTLAGKWLASAGKDGNVRLWDTATGKHWLVTKQDRVVLRVALSPDGKLLAAGDEKGTIRVWSVP